MKILFSALTLCLALSAPATAQDHSAHGQPAAAATDTSASQAALTAGEVTRVDARGGKLTIRHGAIYNLDMPPMTMVFALQDSAQASQFKPGDKVLFQVEDRSGALVITHIQAAL